jgi:hypothetical protein
MYSLPEYLERKGRTLMKKGSKKAAWDIIHEYFTYAPLEDIKEELWVLTKGTITNDLMYEVSEGVKRHNLIFGHEFLKMFLDAVYRLYEIRKEKELRDSSEQVQRFEGDDGEPDSGDIDELL